MLVVCYAGVGAEPGTGVGRLGAREAAGGAGSIRDMSRSVIVLA